MTNIPRISPNVERPIELLTYPCAQLLDIAGPLQAFSTANDIAVSTGGPRPYRLKIVSQDGANIATSAGLEVATSTLPSGRAALDTLIVAGGPGVNAAIENRDLVRWLRSRMKRARRIASVCTGAFLLAATGVLDGRRATTHWSFCKQFAIRFPDVIVEPDPIFVRDDTVWTSAGVTAGIDLALALIEQDLGKAAALAVARHIVVFLKRPGGQAQFSQALSLQVAEDKFGALHVWIDEHLSEQITLSDLAHQAGMSERSLSRRYLEATGITPARAIKRLRVEAARRLLSETRLPIKRIARQCGFGSEETMRRSFLQVLSVAPKDYRERFPT